MKTIQLFLLCLLSSCTHQKSTDTLGLPILNIAEDDYPIRKIDIHDIADVEYIPLESSDSTLLGMEYIYVSAKYIVASDGAGGGNVYFFDHSGKFLWKFNRKGPGPEEYVTLKLAFVDFVAEECNVYDTSRYMLLTYSFKGELKRSISLKGLGRGYDSFAYFNPIVNYDKDFLLGYDYGPIYFLRELPDKSPYSLINKKDGTRRLLDLRIQNRLTNQIYNRKDEYIGHLPYTPILQNGSECWISELSCDTIYSLIDKRLVPLAIQSPSVHSTTPPLTIFSQGFTDYFFYFYVVPLFVDEKNPRRPYNESKSLIWNRLTNRMERWKLYNSDIMSSNNSINIPMMSNGTTMKNCGILFYVPESLIKSYKNGVLKGELKEIASKLREDDNNVVVSIKFRKEKIEKVLVDCDN